jgi:hypothetical protein
VLRTRTVTRTAASSSRGAKRACRWVGAGAGTTAAYATGKKEVGFAAERTLTFKLTQPLTVQK